MKKRGKIECWCDVCGKQFWADRIGTKYDSNKCRQWAYQNRKRIKNKALSYGLTPEQNEDLRKIGAYSEKAYATVLRVASVAGRDIASDVLDACWDILIQTGSLRLNAADELMALLR